MMRVRQVANRLIDRNDTLHQLLLFAVVGAASLVFGLVLARSETPVQVLALALGLLALTLAGSYPELLSVALISITWGYISEILVKYHDMPSAAKSLVVLMALVVLWRRFFGRQRATGFVQHPLQWWMLFYLLVICGGLWYAQYPQRTELIIIDFAKELLLFFVIVNLVTSERWFERSVWGMLVVGSVIGTLTLYQELTHSYGSEFGGLARSTVAQIADGISNRARAGGTTGEPNAFGQQMLVLVPLGLWAALQARTVPARLFGGYAALICLAGAGLSFSRGTYLAVLVIVVLTVLQLRLNPRYLLVLPLLYFALSSAPAELRARFGTLNSLLPGAQEENIESDASIRRRSVQVLMAVYMFADNPLIGVGADNYQPLYPEYIRQFGSNVDDERRNAHSYYLEVAAEHGIVGIVSVGGIMLLTLKALRDARRLFGNIGNKRMADLAGALTVAFVGYAVSATFLHGDYTRFLWLQVDLAAALAVLAQRAYQQAQQTAPVDAPTFQPATQPVAVAQL